MPMRRNSPAIFEGHLIQQAMQELVEENAHQWTRSGLVRWGDVEIQAHRLLGIHKATNGKITCAGGNIVEQSWVEQELQALDSGADDASTSDFSIGGPGWADDQQA